jgi:hypothetical protein
MRSRHIERVASVVALRVAVARGRVGTAVGRAGAVRDQSVFGSGEDDHRIEPVASVVGLRVALARGRVGTAVGRAGAVRDQSVFGSGEDDHRYSLGVSTESGIHAFHTPGHTEAACNPGSARDLTADAGRPPTLHTKIDSAEAADRQVARGAGAGRIP